MAMMRTVLTHEVWYDDDKTDADGIARAFDKILFIGMSNLADSPLTKHAFQFADYGKIQLDPKGFLPEKPFKFHIDVEGGVVQDVYIKKEEETREFSYQLHDFDVEDQEDEEEETPPGTAPGGGLPADE